ncbi:Alpha/Beta hydrolase protein [Hypoxylon rubiginosum]|uniref:Alpha/Beta hydrolase protein n=1 Tax=Hypoxylon rubiginosum TaxID=110542 RepID=A0ACB9Z9T3_9PEZI|nr:Alpha/Beta hydrolase protein [Hypoxylon rubiginosum]
MSSSNRQIYQPIHPDVRAVLDPEYVSFHDQYFQYLVPDDQTTWDGSARVRPTSVPATESIPVAVGDIRDLDLGNYNVRVFTPETQKPNDGWPVFLWFHGGGWAVGDISSGNDVCALICQRAQCVVVTVGYRLAPEHPFPAAADDAVHALRWVHGEEGSKLLGVDRSRIAVGGTSAGAQLAASLAMEASVMQPPIKVSFQLLAVPVIDNTATASTIWASRKNAPWLTPARMTWYRQMYFLEETSTHHWRASPNLAPTSLLSTSPKTWIATAEQDLLAPEGELYAKQLTEAWKEHGITDAGVTVKEYKGSTHSILAMSGVLSKGRELLQDVANQAAEWFTGR